MTERINEKLLANTPKGGKLGSDGILRHNGKEYVARSMDITGNKVIYEQIMNSKDTGNFKMMQGDRFVSTSKPVQATEGTNYKFVNFVYDPKNINTSMKFIDFTEGYLPGIPSTTKAGVGGWLIYQTLHPKEFYDGVIVNYDAIKSVFVDKDKK